MTKNKTPGSGSDAAVKPAPTTRRQVLLDDVTIERLLPIYPAKIREAVFWLAVFTREECSSSLPVLVAKCQGLGLSPSVSYFTKILNFTYGFKEQGQSMITNFLAVTEALQADKEAAARAGRTPFIDTEVARAITDYIDMRRPTSAICRMGLIVGATGTQKTACAKHYKMTSHGKIAHLDAPARPSIPELVTDLAECFGVARSHGRAIKDQNIAKSVNAKCVIFVENIQRLYRPGDGWQQPVFDYLQKLQEKTNCVVIMTCTVDFLRLFQSGADKGYFEQFEGRCGGADDFLVLDEFPSRADVLLIAETFGLVDAKHHIQYLEQLTRRRGRIRILFHRLQTGLRNAMADKLPLTIDYLTERDA